MERGESLPYRIVCTKGCKDEICVSRALDGDARENPFLPPYPYKQPEVEFKIEELDKLTEQMPGAFRD